MPTEKPRVTFTISEEKLTELEEYKFKNKIKNQTQAILALLEKGLSDFESKEGKASPYSEEAQELAKDYDGLDDHGKRLVRLIVDEEKDRCKAEAEVEALAQKAANITRAQGLSEKEPDTQVSSAKESGGG